MGEELGASYVEDYVMDMLKEMADVSLRAGLEQLSDELKRVRYEYLSGPR